ncbi:hypothetical protein ACEQPO_24435 [Bacillus sp. SL00103]
MIMVLLHYEGQFKALALDLMDNHLFVGECPNEWCGNKIAWGDMNIAREAGQCYHCVNQEERLNGNKNAGEMMCFFMIPFVIPKTQKI